MVACGVQGFRAFALDDPYLFRLFFTAQLPRADLSADADSTREAALAQLVLRVERAWTAGLLGGHTVEEVTLLWDALCTGLAMREICGQVERSQGERVWTDALGALLAGLGLADRASDEVTESGCV
ncbi:MAG: TetR-like C-terminal domain-containing protein [Candidatus Dormibacteria bacterium]